MLSYRQSETVRARRETRMMNYYCFGGGFYLHYVYADTEDYYADALFNRQKIKVRYGNEYRKDNVKYRIVFCKVRKKYKEAFEKAMEELVNKMDLLSHRDYEDFCRQMQHYIANTDPKKDKPKQNKTK